MKQNNLELDYRPVATVDHPCWGKLVFLWGGFGFVIAWIWQLAGARDPLGGLAVWALALVAGLALAFHVWEGGP